MTSLQARAEAAANAALNTPFLDGSSPSIRSWMVQAALHALQSEGWRPISEAIDGALMMEVVDNGRWSLLFDFGTGDEACHRMRAMANAFRALPAPPEGEGA